MSLYHTLILSGGGTKGLSILGSLQYMQDTKRIDCEKLLLYRHFYRSHHLLLSSNRLHSYGIGSMVMFSSRS